MPANPLSALPNIFGERGFLLSPAYNFIALIPRLVGKRMNGDLLARLPQSTKKRKEEFASTELSGIRVS